MNMLDRLKIEDSAAQAFLVRLLMRSGECVPEGTHIVLKRRDGVCSVVYQYGRTSQERQVIEDDTGYFRFEKLVTLRDGEFEDWGERFFPFESGSVHLYIRCSFRDRDALGEGTGIGYLLSVCRSPTPSQLRSAAEAIANARLSRAAGCAMEFENVLDHLTPAVRAEVLDEARAVLAEAEGSISAGRAPADGGKKAGDTDP